jgi:6-pyruvoyl-tetrahydropterin synthase
MNTKIQCNIKEPHSHLVAGVTYECEKGDNGKTKDWEKEFDVKYDIENDEWNSEMGIPSPHNIKSFISQKLDQALENRREEIRREIESEKEYREEITKKGEIDMTKTTWANYGRKNAIKDILALPSLQTNK